MIYGPNGKPVSLPRLGFVPSAPSAQPQARIDSPIDTNAVGYWRFDPQPVEESETSL